MKTDVERMDLPVASAVSKYIPTSWQANPHVWCLQLQFHRVLCLKYSNIIPVDHTPILCCWKFMEIPRKKKHVCPCLSLDMPRSLWPSVVVMSISQTFTKIRGRMVILWQISGLSVEPVVPRVEFRFRCTIWLWLAVCHGKSTHL